MPVCSELYDFILYFGGNHGSYCGTWLSSGRDESGILVGIGAWLALCKPGFVKPAWKLGLPLGLWPWHDVALEKENRGSKYGRGKGKSKQKENL